MTYARRASSRSPYEARYGFCRAVRVGDRVEVAGTAPIPEPGGAIAPDAAGQMSRCGQIALEALAELGGSPAQVVRTRMYIVDRAEADEIGRAHAEIFGIGPPVATMVVVAGLLDPAWKVELEIEADLKLPA